MFLAETVSSGPDHAQTRFVRLDMGQVRDHGRDVRTVISTLDELASRGPVPFEALFMAHYRSIRALARLDVAGAGVIAVHAPTGLLAGRLWVARHEDRANAGIVGRHSVCDLVLDDPRISLRHLAFVLPAGDRHRDRFSLHELRTSRGLVGELGQPMGGAHVEGAGLFRIGPFALFAFNTGTPERWPELASDAWRDLSGRTQGLRVVRPDPERQRPIARPARTPSVTAIRGPMRTNEILLSPGGVRACTLSLASGPRRQRLALGEAALERGVLLGRYSRCDSGDVLSSKNISRIHLLVLRVDDDLLAIDTASSHGVFRADDDQTLARVVRLDAGEIAVLGDGDASVRLAK